jgi:hypothetical protein
MQCAQGIQDYLETQSWKYKVVRPGTFKLSWESKPVDYDEVVTVVDLDELGERVTFSMSPQMHVPEEKLWEVLDLLNRHNQDIVLGKWTVDFDDGKIYFQASMIFSGTIGTELIAFLFALTGYENESVMPGVMSVVLGGRDASEVAKEIADS